MLKMTYLEIVARELSQHLHRLWERGRSSSGDSMIRCMILLVGLQGCLAAALHAQHESVEGCDGQRLRLLHLPCGNLSDSCRIFSSFLAKTYLDLLIEMMDSELWTEECIV